MRNTWLWCCLIFSLPVAADECAVSADRYTERGVGAVQDKKTGLIWMRCPLGMSWDGKNCWGRAEAFTWDDANGAVREFNDTGYAGGKDWRLPTREELLGIAESGCFDPAVSSAGFPNAPSTGYWTSTEDADYRPGAFLVHFRPGRDYMGNKNQDWILRLVRGR